MFCASGARAPQQCGRGRGGRRPHDPGPALASRRAPPAAFDAAFANERICVQTLEVSASLGARPAHITSAGDDAVPAHRPRRTSGAVRGPRGRAGRAGAGRRPPGRGRGDGDGARRQDRRVPSRGTGNCSPRSQLPARERSTGSPRPASSPRLARTGGGATPRHSQLSSSRRSSRRAEDDEANIGVGGGALPT